MNTQNKPKSLRELLDRQRNDRVEDAADNIEAWVMDALVRMGQSFAVETTAKEIEERAHAIIKGRDV